MSIGKYQSHFMMQALELAAQRQGFCAPNPAVGAVVVSKGRVIGQGSHWAYGEPHAEVAAIRSVGEIVEDAELYVTLEPCSHFGKTPPCTDLILNGGIRTVYYGMADPNPRVKGGGAQILQQEGIHCEHYPSEEIDSFYQSYRYWLKTNLPLVTIKLAVSLDGKIAGAKGQPIQITGAKCQERTHLCRQYSDAILTSAATILADDPQLNARTKEGVVAKHLYIVDSQLQLPLTAKVLTTAESVTVFHAASASQKKLADLQSQQITCRAVNNSEQGLLLSEVLASIGKDGRHDLWVEAGPRLFKSFISQGLAQKAIIYISPSILGPMATSAHIEELNIPKSDEVRWSHLGADAILELVYNP